VKRRLDVLVEEVRNRDQQLDALHEALADRMNNLLMAIKTASDLLRGDQHESVSQARERIDATVENGRHSVKRLRESLSNLR